jgi:hypothetical protein
MLDIALNDAHDLDTTTLDLVLLDGAARVRQQLEIKLRLWQGEWFLDTEFGTPYLAEILGKQLTLSGSLAALRASILEVDDVLKITEFNYAFTAQTRKLTVTFTVDTPFGTIEVTA